MAHWIIRLDPVFQPLMNLLREEQNNATYLQADETRIQVLKEAGKTAQLRILVKLNSDSGICEHHFRKVC